MPVNYSIYNALRSRPGAERRQRAMQQNMAYIGQLNQMLSQEQFQMTRAQQEIDKQLMQFSNVQALEKDQENLLSLIKSEEKKIIKGIRDSGGDAQRYINTGGITNLRKYYNNIKSSEQLNTALTNKKNDLEYQEGIKRGLLGRPSVFYFNEETGEESTPDDPNAVKKVLSYNEQKELYNKGAIKNLKYRGVEKPIILDQRYWNQVVNPNSPTKRGPVSVEAYMSGLMSSGQDPLVARTIAESARVGNSQYTMLNYGVDAGLRALAAQTKSKYDATLAKIIKGYEGRQFLENLRSGDLYAKEKQPLSSYAYNTKGKMKKNSTLMQNFGTLNDGEVAVANVWETNFENEQKNLAKIWKEYYNINKDDNKMYLDLRALADKNYGESFMIEGNDGRLMKIALDPNMIGRSAINLASKPKFEVRQEMLYNKQGQMHFDPQTMNATGGQQKLMMKLPVVLEEDQIEQMELEQDGWWAGFLDIFGEDLRDDAQVKIEDASGSDYELNLYLPMPDTDSFQAYIEQNVKFDPKSSVSPVDPLGNLGYSMDAYKMLLSNPSLQHGNANDYLMQSFMQNYMNTDGTIDNTSTVVTD